MAAPTPKNPSTTKATQTNMALSFTTANPDGYPISYADDVWDAVEQNTAMSDVMEGTGQYDQKTINEQLAGKIGSIDLSVFEKVINKVISISAQSTDVQYPTAKLLYDSLQALANVYAAKANTYTKTEVDNLIASISTVSFVVVATLPTTDIQTNVIYLVPSSTAQQQNIYDEYIYSNNAWEHIGSTAVDLSGYELKINKVTSISAQSTDNEYPSAKLLYDSLQALSNVFARIADLASVAFSGSYNDLSNKPTIPAAQVNSDWNSNSGVSQILNKPNVEVQGNKVTVLSPQNTDVQYPSAKAVYDCCAEVKEFLENLDERVTRLEGFHYMITGAALQGTIVIELNGELLAYQVGSDHAYEFKYKEPIQTLDFRAANIVSVSFYDSDSLIGLVSCDELFKNCVELIAVDFANKTFGAVISATDMFSGCVSLTTLTCPNTESWKPDLNFSDCEDLTQASLESLIDNFLFVYSSGDHIITPNQVMWGRISHADQDSIIARATAKGWQLNVGSRYNISGTSNGSIVNITVDGTAVTVPVVSGVWNYGYQNTLSSISFANDTHVQTIDFSLSDGLSGITSLASAFSGCTALTSVDFTNCNLLNIASASNAFSGCSALTNLTIPTNYWKPDVSLEDSPLITYAEMIDIIGGLYYYPSGTHTIMFNSTAWDSLTSSEQLSVIQAADLKGWDTNALSSVYYIRGRVNNNLGGTGSFGLQFIDLATRNFSTETVTVDIDNNGYWEYEYSGKKIYSTYSAFRNNTHLINITFTEDFSECSNMSETFSNCSNLIEVNLSNAVFGNLINAVKTFYNCSCTKIDLSSATFSELQNGEQMFNYTTNLSQLLGIENFTFASLTNALGMFGNMHAIGNGTLDLSSATFANLTNASQMFENSTGIVTLDLSSATFANLTNANRMFQKCSNMTSITWSANLNLENLQYVSVANNYNGMFSQCSKLTTISEFGNFKFNNLLHCGGWFWQCESLTSVDLHSAEFNNVQSCWAMFQDCFKLTTINMPRATFSELINGESFAYKMTNKASSLTTINLPLATMPKVTNAKQLFYGWENLTTINVPNSSTAILPTSLPSNAPLNVGKSPLDYTSMLKIANWLSDLSGQSAHTFTVSIAAWNALSAAEQATIQGILNSKNWTLTGA